ncbi:MAG: bifunctional glutamate N-acetyltransferase/amino-acid acetyltransferase ArgJ [Phycisphaerae bacterium]|jgi:glutamate N-acetyltransferase/amino-acid N-acetyltransferase
MRNDTITSPRGFLAVGLHCGIKKSGKFDLGIIVCPTGARAAAMFTTNKIFAAPVAVSKKHIHSTKVFGVVVNSGNANACTGKEGIDAAIKMCRTAAGQFNADPHQILVTSTGIIGHPLPIKKITSGIVKASAKLSSSPSAGLDFSKAIMTTDTKVKSAYRQLDISGRQVKIAGTVKGAGMIAPNMATTLCFITTDIVISKRLLSGALRTAIGQSLNKLTVDGHQSTNDTVIILTSELAGNSPILSPSREFEKFSEALCDLCQDLARQMAADAEGATRIFKVVVEGAASKKFAQRCARAIANYDLVKCAIHGADPNWGRIICAAGSSGVKLNPKKLSCKIGDTVVFRNGRPAKFNPKAVSKIIAAKEHTITVNLGIGKASDFCYGCDLSKDYVTINADYHT